MGMLQFTSMMYLALFIAAADPRCRPVVYLAFGGIIILIIGLIDRGIAISIHNIFLYGVWLQPTVRDS